MANEIETKTKELTAAISGVVPDSEKFNEAFNVLSAVFSTIEPLLSSKRIEAWITNNDEIVIDQFVGNFNIFLASVNGMLEPVDKYLSGNDFSPLLRKKADRLNELTQLLNEKFPPAVIEMFKQKKAIKDKFDTLLKAEEEVKQLDEQELSAELKALQAGNEEKRKLLAEKHELLKDIELVQNELRKIEHEASTVNFISQLTELLARINERKIAREELLKLKTDELLQKKELLVRIEKELNDIEAELQLGYYSLDITNFYEGFDKAKMKQLREDINDVLQKLKKAIEEKEKLVNNLKGAANGK